MKVGILTQPLRSNYGAILQNWALQQVLISLGHEPVTLRFALRPKKQVREEVVRCVIHNILRTRGRHVLHLPGWYYKPYRHMLSFVNRHIRRTRAIELGAPIKSIPQFDAYVVGSDQVWRPMYNAGQMLRYMYARDLFAPGQNKRIFAYAASFGVDCWEYTDDESEMARDAISAFDKVSVREASAVGLCSKYLNIEAQHVLDPTLLMISKDYEALIDDKSRAYISEGALGVFILDMTDDKRHKIETVAREMGLEPFYFGLPEFQKATSDNPMQPVEYWLAAFSNCRAIVTDSFHGTVFSIIFRKPFITIVNNERGASRFSSLLESFGLQDRMTLENMQQSIDWKVVESRLDEWRESSIGYIKSCLS